MAFYCFNYAYFEDRSIAMKTSHNTWVLQQENWHNRGVNVYVTSHEDTFVHHAAPHLLIALREAFKRYIAELILD